VQLKIQRSDQEDRDQVLDLNVIRDRISINPVQASLERPSAGPIIGYIRLRQFNANATSEMKQAIERLETQGATAYVLDLRNNPGGLLQAGVEIARLWLDSGPIVYTVDRQGVFDNFMANGPALTHAPLVVLVNRGSASASEILAGALQDTNRAQLVGERTFGKGLIQSLFNLSDGSGLAVTIAKYETPNHTDINKVGITPNLVIPQDLLRMNEMATPADIQYQAALDLLTQHAVIAGAPSS
jgi:carboxyl-terminal processing protease